MATVPQQRIVYRLVAVEDIRPTNQGVRLNGYPAWPSAVKQVDRRFKAKEMAKNANRRLQYSRADRLILKNSFQSCTPPQYTTPPQSPPLTPSKMSVEGSVSPRYSQRIMPSSIFRMNLFPPDMSAPTSASPIPAYVPPQLRSYSPASSATPSEYMSDEEQQPHPKRRRRRKKSSASEFSEANETAGKLQGVVRYFFCQAYGLEGVKKRSHAEVISDACSLTQCSERAINEALYGHSYGQLLNGLRECVPDYPSNKVANKQRNQQLADTLRKIEYGTLQHLTLFDGNMA